MAEEKKNVNWTMIVLVSLLVLTVGYIAFSEYSDWKATQENQIYQQGAQDAITQISQTAAQCQEVPLQTENETVTLVSVECLQQEQGEQQVPEGQEPSQEEFNME